MIIGAPQWNNRNNHYSQENNPTEQILKKSDVSGYLESCGPTSAVNCIAALGRDVTVKCPGHYRPQPEEVMTDFFHDPRNYDAFRAIRKATDPAAWMGNRIPQFYPHASREVFGVNAKFGYYGLDDYIILLRQGKAIQCCLIKPGHYIAVVAYDTETKEFIFNDSWCSRPGNKNRGFNERIGTVALSENMRSYAVIYG